MPHLHSAPCAANAFLASHAALLVDSYHRLTGKHLLPPDTDPTIAAESLFNAPFVVLSHDNQDDPIFTYGNRTAQNLFELEWDELLQLPSRYSAEAPNREERARLLQQVTEKGFIDNYQGIRISKTGKRFMVKDALVWNLIDANGVKHGQAAAFSTWLPSQ